MKYIGHIITLIGAGLAVYGAMGTWFIITDPANVTEATTVTGLMINPGQVSLAVAAATALLTLIAFALKRRALVVSESLTALVIMGMVVWAIIGRIDVTGASEGFTVAIQSGLWLTMGGAGIILLGALRVFAVGPAVSPRSRPLRVAMLWNGTVINEQIFDEPHNVTIGEDIKSTFTVPAGAGVSKKFVLFHGSLSGKYDLGLTREMTGQVTIGNDRLSIAQAIESKTSGRSGTNRIKLASDDWGIIHVGALAIFFQFIQPERTVRTPLGMIFDGNAIASFAFSALLHVSLILATLFLWEETAEVKRRPVVFKIWDVNVDYEEEEEEEEEEDEGEEEDTTAKRAEGDEGKFGDPDIDPMLESKVPERDGKMVAKIDPKKVGLVDMLSTSNLGGIGAIANILNKNTQGLSDKMAVAMAGAGTEFVMGHGSGGMGFKGTGTGGGGVGGYGRIHGLGKIDTGGGTGMHGSLGRKRAKKVGKVRIGRGASTGFCKKGDIARAVRRRANSIRACYEQRLQVNPNLRGKVTARWTIGLNGRVQKASTAGNTLGDGAVTSCILRVIRRMAFPRPEGGICIVQWPFVFNPGG